MLGLLGRTGSGKTTIARLLARLYDPEGGTVRVGGVDLRQAALADVRRRVGVVTQDVQLFGGSVRENLTFLDGTVEDVRLFRALEELQLDAWLRRLPAGLDTPVGPGGMGLSGGEAQLLAFVRVLLRNPGVVVLDEASSRLDPATERLLEGALQRLLRDRTAIIIAHRLSTVARADTIMVLDRGHVIEWGARPVLAADAGSRFAALLRAGSGELLA